MVKQQTTGVAILVSSLSAGCLSMDYVAHDPKETPSVEDLPPDIHSIISTPNPVENNTYITIEAYVTDDYGVDAVFLQIDGETASMDTSTAPSYTIAYDTSILPIGENLFSIFAVDTAGQESGAESSFIVNNVTSTAIESLILNPYVVSTANLADSVSVTLTATDSFYDLSTLEGSCVLESVDLGTLSYNTTNQTHELSFLPEIGITPTDLGEIPVTCTITNPAGYSVSDSTSLIIYDGIPPALDCTATQEGNNDGSASLEIRCTSTDENGVDTVQWQQDNLGNGYFTNTESDTFVTQIDVTGTPATGYAFLVTSVDNYKNSAADIVNGTVYDVTAPNIACFLTDACITNNAISGSGLYNAETTYDCTITDETSLASVVYDAGSFGSGTMSGSGSTYSVTLSGTEIAADNYSISATAQDSAGNTMTSTDTFTVIDELAPTFTSVTSSPSSVLSDGSEEFSLEVCVEDETDGLELGTGVTVEIDSYTNSLSYGSTCYALAINGNEFSEGDYSILLQATDAAGNTAEDTSAMITIDSITYTTTTLYADEDVRTSEENATTNYNGYSLYVGASTVGRGRSYISFDSSTFTGAEVTSALLTIYAASGTCHSSSNNHDCNHDLVVDAHEITSTWSAATATWNSVPSYDTTVLDSATMNEAFGGGGSYTFDVTSLVQTWADGSNYGVLLKADSTGESTSNQVDAGIESIETGLPATLEVTYGM
ncbi:DNRLRE domain-containing protein [Candidatus Woesearchaeota archaeon]|nr:DNRLRE domain-containing protein [Candidatus Woesearchaeota archaeon]